MKNILVAFLIIVSLRVFSQTDSVPSFVKDSLDSYVNRALTDWQIPGIAVCIIKNGKVLEIVNRRNILLILLIGLSIMRSIQQEDTLFGQMNFHGHGIAN